MKLQTPFNEFEIKSAIYTIANHSERFQALYFSGIKMEDIIDKNDMVRFTIRDKEFSINEAYEVKVNRKNRAIDMRSLVQVY